jgi:hypothetical protein
MMVYSVHAVEPDYVIDQDGSDIELSMLGIEYIKVYINLAPNC